MPPTEGIQRKSGMRLVAGGEAGGEAGRYVYWNFIYNAFYHHCFSANTYSLYGI